MRDILTTRVAADELDVTRGCIIDHIDQGHLTASRHGNSYLILRTDFEVFKRDHWPPRAGRPKGKGKKTPAILEGVVSPDEATD